MGLKGLNFAGKTPPTPKPKVVAKPAGAESRVAEAKPSSGAIDKNSRDFARIVKEETQETDRVIAEGAAVLNKTPHDSPVVERDEKNIKGEDKLSRLVDDDFPFDDTQLTAIYGIVQEQYACMIGAAGTGKTTTTKKLVDMLREGLEDIDVSQYWKRGDPDEKDDYEVPERLIPSIAMVSFTGRATQMIKKNFPRDWHSNIMTIHRALGFYPEYYQEFDDEVGEMVGKRKFVPAYTEENQMPWDIIIIDEAGMLGLELWHQLWAATKSSCRIIMIGDINQLPPTHGKSVLGFALANWPTWELTHVHRQQGENNSIVDNAHRILKGLRPVSDSPKPLSLRSEKEMIGTLNYMVKNDDWRFLLVDVDEEHRVASIRIRQMLQLLQGKLYEPNRDVVITPINGYEQTAPGFSLGQSPMNQELVTKLNSKNPRYIIDAGREKQNFAVGDKVMATVNDYEAGITNGMTGIITGIQENGAYVGDTNRWGLITEVNEYLSGLVEDDGDVDFSLEEMVMDSQAGIEELKKKEKRDGGPSSHVVDVQFGEGEHAFTISFASKSQVASLMLAYVATCHKMQGGECPVVFVILHQSNKRPLNREWFYTAVTRAAERCVVLTTRQGMGFALGKQNIKGATLEAKVKTFQALTRSGPVGPSVRVSLPKRQSLSTEVTPYQPKEITAHEKAQSEVGQPSGEAGRKDSGAERSEKERPSIKVGSIHIHIHESRTPQPESRVDDVRETPRHEPVDGGEIQAETRETARTESPESNRLKQSLGILMNQPRKSLPAPPRFISTYGAVNMMHRLEDESQKLLLTHQPKPQSSKPLSLGQLLAAQKNKRG